MDSSRRKLRPRQPTSTSASISSAKLQIRILRRSLASRESTRQRLESSPAGSNMRNSGSKTAWIRRQSRAGFTLLELLTVVIIIAILSVLVLPAIGLYRARTERLGCVTNMKGLYVAAANYTTDNQHWPQIPLTKSGSKEQARAWHAALLK